METPHALSIEETALRYGTDPVRGLREEDARKRLKLRKSREGDEEKGLRRILYEQFTSLMMLLLFLATVISLFIGQYISALVMLVVILLNGFIGVFQEYRAEKSLPLSRDLPPPESELYAVGQRLLFHLNIWWRGMSSSLSRG